MKKKASRCSAFTLVEIMIVVGIIGLLAAIAIPNFVRARVTSKRATCINNLRQIDAAVQQWAMELKKAPGDVPAVTDILPYMKHVVACPSGGTDISDSYTLPAVTNQPTCNLAPDHVLPPNTQN
jgi:prepilin-type N-terminal cleavage/methylation domain-containing protein